MVDYGAAMEQESHHGAFFVAGCLLVCSVAWLGVGVFVVVETVSRYHGTGLPAGVVAVIEAAVTVVGALVLAWMAYVLEVLVMALERDELDGE